MFSTKKKNHPSDFDNLKRKFFAFLSTEDGHSASIQFPMTSTKNLTDFSANCLLTRDLKILPDPTSNSNKSGSGVVSLQPYAALQLTLYEGKSHITMVTGEFSIMLPVSDKDLELKEGDKIPAWYFDENTGMFSFIDFIMLLLLLLFLLNSVVIGTDDNDYHHILISWVLSAPPNFLGSVQTQAHTTKYGLHILETCT